MKMKKSLLTFAIVLAVLASCSKPESFDDGFSPNNLASGQVKTISYDAKSAVLNGEQFPKEEGFCSVIEYELIAGRTTDVGDVLVGNDGTSLYIKIFSEDGFQNVDENVKIWIGTEMPFEARPSAGQFPHKYTAARGEKYLLISFSLEELKITCEDQVYIIIHADVPGETAFAGVPGTMHEGGAWWYHILFSLDCCSNEGIVAFARKTYEPMVHCFLNLDMNSDGIMDFDTWGWTNGALGQNETAIRTYELFINAEGCDVSNSKKVGEVKLLYFAGEATVTFNLLPGYVLSETSLFIGNDMLPKDGGVYTTDPSKYPYKHTGLGGVATDSYIISGLAGSIYVIAHAMVIPDSF